MKTEEESRGTKEPSDFASPITDKCRLEAGSSLSGAGFALLTSRRQAGERQRRKGGRGVMVEGVGGAGRSERRQMPALPSLSLCSKLTTSLENRTKANSRDFYLFIYLFTCCCLLGEWRLHRGRGGEEEESRHFEDN